jgi:septal ring factor EnvC (AmiA/AmiB activator)
MQEKVVGQRGRLRQSMLAPYIYAASTRSTTALRTKLANVADSLSVRMTDLGYESQVQARSLRNQEQKRVTVAQSLTQQKKEIQSVRASKQQLIEELRKKQQSAAKIRSLIEQLVARDRSKRSPEKQRAKPGLPASKRGRTGSAESTVSSSAPQRGPFKTNSLPWPTPGRSVLHGYGTYTNPSTGTSHENPGIDIKASTGTSVACVAKGLVSTVTWLPGFGSLVIVDHLNGFRTVYANLASVSVHRGSELGPGSRIGASGSNLDGDVVHFEIWIDGKRINPLTYLR